MVLDYLPLNYEKTYEFIYDECGYNDCISTEEIMYDLIDDKFCKYIYKNSKNNGQMCLRKTNKRTNYNGKYRKCCGVHRYVLERRDLRIEIKKNKQKRKCKINKCNNLVKYDDLCNKHFRFKTKIEKVDNISINNLLLKNDEYYKIDYYRYYYPWTIDIKIKELDKKIHPNHILKKLICYKNKINVINTRTNDKYKLEYYLSNIYYVLKVENSITFIKTFILELLDIISNNMNLNIINKNFNKYKTTIKPVIDTKIIKKYDYDFDYFYQKDFTKYLKKININDIFCNNGYKYLKLITYKNNNLNINIDMDNSIKKHNMKLWDIWNFKNEHPKPNLDGSIDWKNSIFYRKV